MMKRIVEPRKRPSPLPPPLLDHFKRERRLSSQSSETSVGSSEDSSSKHKCRLCKNQVVFKNMEDFEFHLSVIHYRDKLLDQLGQPPYSCHLCGFIPTGELYEKYQSQSEIIKVMIYVLQF